jgi:hypothetical protein
VGSGPYSRKYAAHPSPVAHTSARRRQRGVRVRGRATLARFREQRRRHPRAGRLAHRRARFVRALRRVALCGASAGRRAGDSDEPSRAAAADRIERGSPRGAAAAQRAPRAGRIRRRAARARDANRHRRDQPHPRPQRGHAARGAAVRRRLRAELRDGRRRVRGPHDSGDRVGGRRARVRRTGPRAKVCRPALRTRVLRRIAQRETPLVQPGTAKKSAAKRRRSRTLLPAI